MRKLTILFSFIFSFNIVYSQIYSIDDNIIYLSDVYTVNDFYQNTYFNSYDNVTVDWNIIESTMPNTWQFSICFPMCYQPGVVSGSSNFTPNSQSYLNCHFYPNNTPGSGEVKMQIMINNQFLDTVTWIGEATSTSNILTINSNSNLSQIIFDLNGRILNNIPYNTPYIIRYNNGVYEKKIKIN